MGMRRLLSLVRVPELVGLGVAAAHNAALDAGVLAVEHRVGSGPGDRVAGTGVTVVRQRPVGGCEVTTGSWVDIWTTDAGQGPDDGGGGGGGVRPNGPLPLLPAGTK